MVQYAMCNVQLFPKGLPFENVYNGTTLGLTAYDLAVQNALSKG